MFRALRPFSLSAFFAAVLSTLCLVSAPSSAQATELTAAEIVARSASNRTVQNSEQWMTMEIYDRNGRSRVRKIVSRVKEGADGVSKSHVEFVEPEDVSGVQFLTVENPKGEDMQWLFMPASGILNQISGSTRRGSFMGSDFTFEDLSVGQAGDGDHTRQDDGTVTIGGKTIQTYVVSSVPKAELKSAYTRIVSYIEKDRLIPRQILFYDKKGENSKRMTILDVALRGDVLVPMHTTMENLKRGTRTEVKVESVEVNVPAERLPDHRFTPEAMQSEG
ncbi:MAG TPA: hypothetical protein DIU15_03665 [Deltaproteobacteria bacterium]|nr:hypothetical protein [Deltaproteobacteria bacterium]